MIIENIEGCARCGQDHKELEMKRFTYPITQATLGYCTPPNVLYTHWSMCPTNNEPILIKLSTENRY